jgi:hypothetical protein
MATSTERRPVTFKEVHHDCGCVGHKCTCKPDLTGCTISCAECRDRRFFVPCKAHRGMRRSEVTDRHVTKVLLF